MHHYPSHYPYLQPTIDESSSSKLLSVSSANKSTLKARPSVQKNAKTSKNTDLKKFKFLGKAN